VEAANKFENAEVPPVCAHLLDGLDNLGFLMAMAQIDDDDFQREKVTSRKEKLERCRRNCINQVIKKTVNYDER
jgi:hypothetical protein